MKYKHIALFRFSLSLVLAILSFFICTKNEISASKSFELSWIVFGLSYIAQGVRTLFHIHSADIKFHAKDEDLGAWLQFFVVISCCAVSLFSLIVWNNNESIFFIPKEVLFVLSISLSWLVVHFSFTFRYAHLYYGDLNEKYLKHSKGLDFPNDEHPDYMDFAYYSFTIGMTFQVSDVTIRSKGMRQLTLLHSIISFVFNTIMVALTINEIMK